MRVLTVVDLEANSSSQRLLKFFSSLAVRYAATRSGPETDRSKRPLVLLLSFGGSAGEVGWLGDVEMVTPLSLLSLVDNARSVQEAVYEATQQVMDGELPAFFPKEKGIDFADLCQLLTSNFLRYGLLMLRAIDEICRTEEIDRIVVISADPALARVITDQFGTPDRIVNTWVPVLFGGLRRIARLFKSATHRWRLRQRRASADGSASLSSLESADVLIVSESLPMRGMFSLVEQELRGLAPGLSFTRIQYGDTTRPLEDTGPRSRTLWLQRPDERVPASHQHQRRVRAQREGFAAERVTQEVLGRSVTLPLSELLEGLGVEVLDQQSEHVAETADLLAMIDPALVVVGNDRWWIGQAFVRLARMKGIPTLMVQDGLATDGAEWFWSTADHLALSSDFLGKCLREHGRHEGMVVVGQPRYDSAFRNVSLPEASGASRPYGVHKGPGVVPRVLFATQTMQDFAFVEAVVGALLAVSGVQIVLRPHPSESVAPHERLSATFPDRLKLCDARDVFDSLRGCDLLVCQSSTVVLEAALLGIPSVTVNFTGMPDLAPYARLGLAVSVSTPSQLTAAVTTLLENPAEYELRSKALRSGPELGTLLGPTDGQAAERTAQLIVALAEGRRRVLRNVASV